MILRCLPLSVACVLLAVPTLSTAQTAGQIGDTLKAPPELKRVQPTPDVERAPAPPPSAPAGGKKIPVNQFAIDGKGLISKSELEAMLRPHAGKAHTLLEIYEIADDLTRELVRRGYTLATVTVPAQRISEGIVKLELIEGKVGQILVEGNKRYSQRTISAFLPKIVPGQPYRGAALADGLNQLNALPGLSTKALLRPGKEYGTSDVVISTREDGFSGSATLDSYGREDVGQIRLSAGGSINNAFGIAEQIRVLGLVSEESLLKYGQIAVNVPVNLIGTRAEFSYGEGRFEVDGNGPVRVEGENKRASLKLQHGLIRDSSQFLSVSAGLHHASGDSDLSGIPLTGGTDLTWLQAGTEYLRGWPKGGATQLSFNVASNFDSATFAELNAPPGMKPRDDMRFRSELDVLHLEPIGNRVEALIRVATVWSPDPLPDTEKFSLGGPGNIRGFPASEIRGDRGILGSLTVRRSYRVYDVGLTPSVFIESGTLTRDIPDDVRQLTGEDDSESLSSTGIGLEVRYRRMSVRADWSFPLNDFNSSDGRDDSRVFGAMSVSF